MQGRIATGEELALSPGARPVRVRSLQVFGAQREAVEGGSRVAVNLSSIERSEIARGAAVTRTAVHTVKPTADNNVRETMDLTSSHIDDTKPGWSGWLGKK